MFNVINLIKFFFLSLNNMGFVLDLTVVKKEEWKTVKNDN